MKKKTLVSAGILAAVLCLIFTACSGSGSTDSSDDLSESRYIGTWQADSMSSDGEEDSDDDCSLVLYSDGSGRFTSDDEAGDFTWELTDKGFRTMGEITLEFTDEGDRIRTEIQGDDKYFAKQSEESAEDGSAYGYSGNDPVEAAVYRYMVVEIAQKHYDTGEGVISVPVVSIIETDDDEKETGGKNVWGVFEVYNYEVDGETLRCLSGGDYPGRMHIVRDGEQYRVDSFDIVADGHDYEASAREIFGDKYDEFTKVISDDTARAERRTQILSDYVKANNLEVTQYQDYGWDPVKLDL